MDKINKMLTKFKVDCIRSAERDASELQLKIKDEVDKLVNEELEPYNVKQEIKFNRSMKELEKEYYASYYAIDAEARQKIIQKQEELKEDFRNELQNKIIKFIRK